jgi:RNA 3'-terminal phosphate cyclase (ATP)
MMERETIQIDGSQGEGGGQILRTALALSMITGKAFELKNIRAGRKKSGLMRQHLVCVQASQRISNAVVDGAELHSQTLYFAPQQVQAGQYEFNIGSAGSTMLVFQTLLPALMVQDQPSQISIEGGTHNPMAPTADFIQQCFLPALQKIGIEVDFKVEQAGFFPVGGGRVQATIQPWLERQALVAVERGALQSINVFAGCLNLPTEIAERELVVLKQQLSANTAQQIYLKGVSQGNTAYVTVLSKQHCQLFTALGEMKKSAERVAHDLAREVKKYLVSEAVVDEHLADQLLLPLALGQGGEFTTQVVSEHTRTQAMMIQKFLDCEIVFDEPQGRAALIKVSV